MEKTTKELQLTERVKELTGLIEAFTTVHKIVSTVVIKQEDQPKIPLTPDGSVFLDPDLDIELLYLSPDVIRNELTAIGQLVLDIEKDRTTSNITLSEDQQK